MIAVVALGQNAWLVPYAPNTTDTCALKARIDVDGQRALTARQSRRPEGMTLRYSMNWTSAMKLADFGAARMAALQSQDEPILVPFWPAARPVGQALPMTAGLIVAWTANWATYAINPGSTVGYTYYAPLLWGRFAQPPRVSGSTNEFVSTEFSFEEDSAASTAAVPPTVADTTFATPDGYNAAIFPFKFDPSSPPKFSLPGYDVDRSRLGFGRQETTVFYPNVAEDTVAPNLFLASSTSAISLLGWWLRRAGDADVFWIPSTQSVGRLTADLAAGVTSLNPLAPCSVRVGDSVALLTTGQTPEFGRVNSIAGGNLVLATPTALAHAAAWTSIHPAILARHMDDELEIDFLVADTDWIATAKLTVREAQPEYSVPTDGETRGTTMGRLQPYAWLLRISLDYAGAVQNWYITSWESGCTTSDAQVWQYQDFDFGAVTQSDDLEEDECTLKIRWWAGCPWANWFPGQLSAIGTLAIFKAPVAADGTVGAPAAVWQGSLSTPQTEGAKLSVKVLGANALFTRSAPQQLMTPGCYKRLYGARCALVLANWEFNAVAVSIAGQTVTIGTIVAAGSCAPATMVGGLPAGFGFADWFTLGWVQWTSGGNIYRAGIIASTALAAGHIVLTLDRAPGFAAAASIIVAPGCDRQYTTCDGYNAGTNPTGKFNNALEHGGFPDMPAIDPSFIIPQTNSTPAKK